MLGLTEEAETRCLTEQVARLHEQSAYFQKKLTAVGYSPGDRVDRRVLGGLPLTGKVELARAGGTALAGANQCVSREALARITFTGGTSGPPMPVGWTARDAEDYATMGARALSIAGVCSEHVVVNCFNYRLYAGGVMDQLAFEALGAATVSYGVGASSGLLDLLAAITGPVCVYMTPSYAVRLAALAAERQIDLRDLGVDLAIFSGEAGLARVRSRLEQAWGFRARDLYGLAELGAQAGESFPGSGLCFPSGDHILTELIDPETGTPLRLDPGMIGELVFTTLRRQACPLLRYRSYDRVRIREVSSRGFVFDHLSRSDECFKSNGVSVQANDILREVLALDAPGLTTNFQLVLGRDTELTPVLRVEATHPHQPSLAARLQGWLAQTLHLHCDVELVGPHAFEGQTKLQRIHWSDGGGSPC